MMIRQDFLRRPRNVADKERARSFVGGYSKAIDSPPHFVVGEGDSFAHATPPTPILHRDSLDGALRAHPVGVHHRRDFESPQLRFLGVLLSRGVLRSRGMWGRLPRIDSRLRLRGGGMLELGRIGFGFILRRNKAAGDSLASLSPGPDAACLRCGARFVALADGRFLDPR
jgi:hypothetical protein